MSMSLACKTIHMSPAAGLYNPATVEMIVSQNDLVPNDQGQILGTEFNLMEMTEVEYTHLQHIIQSHIETQAGGTEDSGDARFNNTIFTVCSPAPQQAATTCEAEFQTKSPKDTPADATSTDEQQLTLGDSNQGQVDFQEFKMVLVSEGNVMSGERTPTTCGEVPSSVLAKVRKAVDMTREHGLETYDTSSAQLQARPNPPARVRLEKRFNCTPFDIPRQQDAQSAALSNFLTMLHHSNEAQESGTHTQPQKCLRSDRGNPGFGNLPHTLEPSKHQALVIPKNFTFSYRQEKMTDKVPCCLNPAEETVWVKVEDEAVMRPAYPAKRGRTRGVKAVPRGLPDAAAGRTARGAVARKRGVASVESSLRRERHNSKERDRRRRIRFCCDELNVLAPFCNQETDKATTLQWTTAFLKYIREVYGDSIKQDFQSTFCGKTGQRIKPSSASSHVMVLPDTAESLSTPQASEQ
ncbi:transcription factor-like 5 protein isoform X2 [Esox lucius]|nr:transcription factor-like 5 protein isoform X2 [Esox lucius]XP_019907149.3 transcription factor-like 5 protein isoform X2 [Esox lucius]